MAEVRVTHKINRSYVKAALVHSPGVRRAMIIRGVAVQTEAKKRLNESPRRIDTGRLRNSIQMQEMASRGVLGVRVGTNVVYALVIHNGSRPHQINARPGGVLAWRGPNGMIFARSVMHPGFRANPFLVDGLRRGMAKFSG